MAKGLDKISYRSRIATYTSRREELRERFGKTSREYKIRSAELTRKIHVWKAAIRRIEAREKKMIFLSKCIREYYGGKVKNNTGRRNIDILCRWVFFKYGMEHKMNGTYLLEFTGLKNENTPHMSRKKLIKKMKVDPDTREKYHKFIEFVKEQQEHEGVFYF